MYRLRFLAPAGLVILLAGGWLMGDDKKSNPNDPPPVRVSLPPNFKKLGLTDTQRRDILRVRANYAGKIDKLKQEIAELQQQEKADVEKLLTDAQRARLREIRSGDTGKDKDKAPPVKPATTDKDKK
jgi:hypothetical protein